MLATPYLAVDVDVLDRNVHVMAERAASRDLALRPHAKTHKCLEIARRQLEAGAVGLTVATVGEAEVFAEAGFADLFIAYTIWADAARAARLRALAERVALRVGVDSPDGARMLAGALAGTDAAVLVEVDCGHHRSGVQPGAAGEVAAAAARAGLRVAGVYTFPGHGYAPGAQSSVAADESAAIAEAAASLRAAGFDPEVRSGGSTPTASVTDGGALTEMRPGVYAFNDAQQLELGVCGPDDLALTVHTTVVGRYPDRIIVDAGSKALGADRAAWATGFGRIAGQPDARVVALSEHHGTVVLPEGAPAPTLGEVLRIIPNHVCNTVNLADEFVALRDGEVIDRWQIAARGANC